MRPQNGGAAIYSYQRDHFVESSQLVFPYADDIGGTIRGYRIFTACRTVNGKIFRLEDHLDRLYYSASVIHMAPPMLRDELGELLGKVLERNPECRQVPILIDVIFSGGLVGATMKKADPGAYLYIPVDLMVPPEAALYEKGVALATYPHQRIFPQVKLLNYVGAVVAYQTVVPQHDAWEVLFVSPTDGQTILEGSTFTVFFVGTDGVIRTPPLDGRILDSVTRRALLELLGPGTEFKLEQVPVRMDDLPSCSEAFLVSTTRNILPVNRIDDIVIGRGIPGPVTRRVMEIFVGYLGSY